MPGTKAEWVVLAAENRDHEDYNIVGKLKKGVALQHAQAEMDTITTGLRRDHPTNYPPNGGLTFGIVPLSEQVVADSRGALFILLFAGVCLLLTMATLVVPLAMNAEDHRWLWFGGLLVTSILMVRMFTLFLKHADRSYKVGR